MPEYKIGSEKSDKFSDEAELELLYKYFNYSGKNTFNDLVFWTETEGDSDLFRDLFFGKRSLPDAGQRVTLLYNYLDSIPNGMKDFENWLETGT